MAMPEVTSSVTPPPPGWAKRFPDDERLFMWLVAASVAAMTAVSLAWLVLGKQNVPTTSYDATPAAYAAKVAAFAQRYGGPDGRVYVPPGTDAYLLASRFTWYPELVLQSGQKYRIWLSSADVLHGFSLVSQGLNLEVVPGHVMGAWLTPSGTGSNLIVCNELCGLGHARMDGRLDVVSAQTMQSYLRSHRASVAAAGATPRSTLGAPARVAPTTRAHPARAAAPTSVPSAAVTELQLSVAGNQLAFDKKALSAHAGKVVITLTNPSPIPHDIAVKGNGVSAIGPIVTGGGHSSVSVVLQPGTYTFYCSVPGHAEAGMQGTLTVTR